MTTLSAPPVVGGTPVAPVPSPRGRRASAPLGKGPRLLWIAIPLIVLLAGLILLPVFAMFYGSLRSEQLGAPGGGFTLDALIEVYTGPSYYQSLIGTVLLALVVAAISTVVGAIIAWILTRTNIRFRGLFEVAAIAPLFLSPFIGAISWVALAAPNSGMLNVNLRHIFGPDFTLVNVMSLPGLVFVLCIYYVPYSYLFVSAALKNMDASLEDASYINGKGTLRTAWRVTIPLVRPAMTASFFFITVLTTGIFSVPGILAVGTGFTPVAVRIYRAIQATPPEPAVASAVGTMLFLLTAFGVLFYRRAVRNTLRYVTISGRGYRPRTIKLGVARPLLAIVLFAYFLVTVILPYVALTLSSLTPFAQTDFTRMSLSIDNFLRVASSGTVLKALQNTFFLAVLTPTIAVVLGLLVAFTAQRSRSRLRGVVDYLATLPIAIPGILLALGMIWVYIRTPVYGTIWILLIAFVAAYIPQASRLIGNGMLQIDRSLEEASTVNGGSTLKTMRRVVLPLTMPAILSAWVMVFIFASREVNEAILLYSPRSTVLSVLTWDYNSAGSLNQAAVVGLLQMGFLLVGVIVARFVFRVRLSSAV